MTKLVTKLATALATQRTCAQMLATAFDFARPLLFALPPETAHELTLKSLEAGIYPRPTAPDDTRLAVSLWGLAFPNPLGIAAGFDKDARVADAVLGMGFGFAEVGSVTPLPQAGNPHPRVFRLIEDGALINRLGFNNGGHAAALARLQARPAVGIVGVNVGANKDSANRIDDYVRQIDMFAPVASYFTCNISSPNTPGLRDLQQGSVFDELTARVVEARERVLLGDVADIAHHVDTSDLSPNALRAWVKDFIGMAPSGLTLLLQSFGFKHGIPLDADLVFDVRCLPNPHYDPALRALTGRDRPVIEFMRNPHRARMGSPRASEPHQSDRNLPPQRA